MPTALIVEDEPDANELLSLLVRSRGYRTESVFRGGDALAAVDRLRPDVLFLDLMLPDLDGFQICREIKRRKDTTLVPVVIITARLTRDCEAEAYEAGANVFVRKPYLAPTIFEALASARAWSEAALHSPSAATYIIDPSEPMGSLRAIAGLTSLLVARTNLDGPSVSALSDALRLLRTSVLNSDGRCRTTSYATVHYTIEPTGVDLRIEGRDGWLDDFTRDEANQALIAGGPFELVTLRPDGGEITLACHAPANPSQ